MTDRPAAPTKLQTDGRSAGDSDDSIEFAEFTGDAAEWQARHGEPPLETGTSEIEAEPPAWFRTKSEKSVGMASERGTAPEIVTSEPTISEQSTSRQQKLKKRDGKESRQSASALIETGDNDPEKLDWKKDWKKLAMLWLISNATCGYGVSVIFHTVVLGAMSAIVYQSMDDNQSITTIITDADEIGRASCRERV